MEPTWTQDNEPGPWTKARDHVLSDLEVDKHKARLERAIRRIDEALDATKHSQVGYQIYDEVADHRIRLDAAKLHLDIYNVMGPRQIEVSGKIEALGGLDKGDLRYLLDLMNQAATDGSNG